MLGGFLLLLLALGVTCGITLAARYVVCEGSIDHLP
jgi:hypothetical protein